MVENKTVIGDKLNEIKSLLGIEKDVDNTSSIEYAWYVGACEIMRTAYGRIFRTNI